MSYMWKEIRARLRTGKSLALATIATEDGSTPRSAGTRMLVTEEGLLAGTVGGGLYEAETIDAAKAALADGVSRLLSVDMSGSMAAGADLICGGRLEIFVQRLDPAVHLPIYESMGQRLERGEGGYLVSRVEGDPRTALLFPEGGGVGAQLPSELSAEILDDAPAAAGLMIFEGAAYFVESIIAKNRLILMGGGHISLAAASMASQVDFDVWVLDDRREFVRPARFPWIDPRRLVAIPEFADCLAPEKIGGPVDERCFVAILTRGHAFDYEALAQALRTKAGYIGMIGSRRKRAQVYEKLLGAGFAREDLDRVHSPIGLAIGAKTPAEIAVSILAELIACRAKAGAEA